MKNRRWPWTIFNLHRLVSASLSWQHGGEWIAAIAQYYVYRSPLSISPEPRFIIGSCDLHQLKSEGGASCSVSAVCKAGELLELSRLTLKNLPLWRNYFTCHCFYVQCAAATSLPLQAKQVLLKPSSTWRPLYGLFCFLNVQQNPNWETLNGLQQCRWQKMAVKHPLDGLEANKN